MLWSRYIYTVLQLQKEQVQVLLMRPSAKYEFDTPEIYEG